MSNFNHYEVAKILISISNKYVNQSKIDSIYDQISKEKEKKNIFENQYKLISENNLFMMLDIFKVNKEIEEIKNNNISLPFHGSAALNNIKNNIVRKPHNYNLRSRNKKS